jgi:peroxiredoxin family protein
MSAAETVDKVSLVVFSGGFERVHYALATAAAAAASNRAATLFFTMGAARALVAEGPGWHRLPAEEGTDAAATDALFRARGIGGFEELLEACVALGVRVMVCEMGLKALGIDPAALRADVPLTPGGLVTFLADASKHGAMLFI